MMWQFQSLCERECGRKSCEDIIAVSFDEHQRYRQRFLQFQLSTIASAIKFSDRALHPETTLRQKRQFKKQRSGRCRKRGTELLVSLLRETPVQSSPRIADVPPAF